MNSNVSQEPKKYSLTDIENFRKDFWKIYKKNDILRKVVFGVCFAALIFFFLIYPNVIPNATSAIQFGGALLSVVVMFIYGVCMKKFMDAKLRDYFKIYYRAINGYAFDSKGFSDVVEEEPSKITIDELREAELYKDLVNVSSRGLTSFKYNKKDYSVVDCAGHTKVNKRMMLVFVGKFIRGYSSYKGKENIIIYLKGSKQPLPPTNIDDVKKVLDDKVMSVYTNYKDWQKVVTKDVIKKISEIKTNDLLADVAISIHDSKQFVALGYDDPLMVPPLEQEFNDKPVKQLKNDLTKVLAAMEELA